MNKVFLIGALGRDPEMRYTPDGDPVTLFSVATERRWDEMDGQRQKATEWFNVVAWNDLAEACKSALEDNSKVYLEGHLQTRCWEDESGEKRYCTEIVAERIVPLDDDGFDPLS